jgi:hyaluronoglucosaminidase
MGHLGEHRMNTFEYAPKDDPYHRERWREPYPADKLAELGELVDRAIANHVDFTFALSPGLSICYTSEADFQALVDKFEAIYDLGARAFNIPLDDIDYNEWHCDSDIERFGTGPAAAGKAQAYILNRVQREWVEPKGDVAPLQMVPTEYYNVDESPYKRELREGLDENVVVMWTGIGVIPETITVEQARQAREVFGHEILVWDNYPVNDYIAGRLPLAPYSGREPGLSDPLVGIVSNPMNQAAASEIALSSFGDFGWNDAAYDADDSWRAATLEKAGGRPLVATALRAFADLSWLDTTLHREQSPRLRGYVDDFWTRWEAGRHREAVHRLRITLALYQGAVEVIEHGSPDPRFVAETDAWLTAARLWLRAGDDALDLLAAQVAGDGAAAWRARQRAEALIVDAKAIRDDKEPHSTTFPRIADGVLDAFIEDAFALHGELLGVRQSRPRPTTTMGTYDVNDPARMVDGDPETFYWSNRAPGAGDAIGVDLGDAYDIGQIDVLMGKSTSPDDYVHNGVLEWSADGETWQSLGSTSTAEVQADATGTTARYVRLRALDGNDGFWVVVREFSVAIDDPDFVRYEVTGVPPAAPGSTLAYAADGDLATTYVANRAPAAGESLVVTASGPRPVERVVVLQRGQPATAAVEVRAGGAWQPIGSVDAEYAELDAGGVDVDAVRLTWAADAPAPQVAEIVLAEPQ